MQEVVGNKDHAASSGRMLGALLRIPAQAVVQRVHGDLLAAGFEDLTLSHLPVFQHLSLRTGLNLTELAEQAQMTKQSMGYLVDFLQAHGYLESVPDANDRRARLIRTTAKGQAVEETARRAILAVREDWSRHLGKEKLETLEATLRELVRYLEETPGQAT